MLSSFVESQYVPSRMVLAAAGYDHEALVSLAESHFGSLPAGEPQRSSPVEYVGGEIRESSASGDDMTHFALSFKVRTLRYSRAWGPPLPPSPPPPSAPTAKLCTATRPFCPSL